MNATERRTDAARRHRVEELIASVRAAREDIVETGLSAVNGMRPGPMAAAQQISDCRAGSG